MNESERDRRLDAAWSAASREEPPPSLDAAIRAAARRAVDAAPQRKRDKHWWYPFAAAAMVALLAVGIIQLTPPEQVAPTIVADMSVAPREANKDVARPVAPVDTKGVEPSALITAPSPAATPSPPAQTPAPRASEGASGSVAGKRALAPASESGTLKRSLAAQQERVAQDKLAGAKPEGDAANTAPPPSVAAPPSLAPPRSEPFPAAAPQLRRDAYAEEREAAANAPAKATSSQVARSTAAPSVEEAQTRNRVAMAKVATADEAKAKEAAARSVEEWIKRIRDLKNAGRQDDAAKELAAFRTAYGERADALLPADLRAMQAQPATK
jgi:hypothetical protein